MDNLGVKSVEKYPYKKKFSDMDNLGVKSIKKYPYK